VLNAGLPVVARRNHSYRVSYYEKDGAGAFIGPGLDATIYEPDVDFKFRNDMATPVLIIGSVTGDKVTFEIYGTKDGRTSVVVGPKLLTEVPSGPAIYAETDALPKGMTRQVETPHPGGTAVATYTVTYKDGRKAMQTFNSRYRPWPAQYLVGTNTHCSTAAQCAQMMAALATPTPNPSVIPAP
jgi:vancomycin resistance protein YoaR